jgi:hypothetical protein
LGADVLGEVGAVFLSAEMTDFSWEGAAGFSADDTGEGGTEIGAD